MIYRSCRFGRSYPTEFFDRLFARDPDPWTYQGDAVSERRKTLLLGMLPTSPSPRLLEIGCAAGWMTEALAERALSVTAVDISPVALELAAARCAGMSHVGFRRLDILTGRFEGSYDVIVCAGVLVFLPSAAQVAVRDRIVDAVEPGGTLILEHTRGAFPGEVAGSRIHALYGQHPQLRLLTRLHEDIYEIAAFARRAVHAP